MALRKSGKLPDKVVDMALNLSAEAVVRIEYSNRSYFVDKIREAAKGLFLLEETVVDFGDYKHNVREETSDVELEAHGSKCKFQITIEGNTARILRIK